MFLSRGMHLHVSTFNLIHTNKIDQIEVPHQHNSQCLYKRKHERQSTKVKPNSTVYIWLESYVVLNILAVQTSLTRVFERSDTFKESANIIAIHNRKYYQHQATCFGHKFSSNFRRYIHFRFRNDWGRITKRALYDFTSKASSGCKQLCTLFFQLSYLLGKSLTRHRCNFFYKNTGSMSYYNKSKCLRAKTNFQHNTHAPG